MWKIRNIQSWRIAGELKAERDRKHFKFEELSKDKQDIIIKSDVRQLREYLHKEELTSVDLVNFYGARCQTLGRELNCSTEEMFESAMQKAKLCDKERQLAIQNGTLASLPYVHGIPISIKDIFKMKGQLSTVGCVMLNSRCDVDSENFLPITEAGAIPLVRGNLPQAALSNHSDNPIWGPCLNVYNRTRTCGGSSGGDAGLVAARCVPMAIGSDVGSSIRIPASFCGISGFKPT